MNLDTTMSVDLEAVEEFIESDSFIQFLLSRTTNLATAAYILQTLEENIVNDKKKLESFKEG